jgi:hypothetical protein
MPRGARTQQVGYVSWHTTIETRRTDSARSAQGLVGEQDAFSPDALGEQLAVLWHNDYGERA